mgnify:CR=1 FL=1
MNITTIGRSMQHDVDPKRQIITEVGDTKHIQLFGTQVLVGIYKRPEKTKGGIILTPNAIAEDIYQSKVGLILGLGPSAFVETDGKWFGGLEISVGDWVIFRPSDGWQLGIGSRECRMLEDASIKGIVGAPDLVW